MTTPASTTPAPEGTQPSASVDSGSQDQQQDAQLDSLLDATEQAVLGGEAEGGDEPDTAEAFIAAISKEVVDEAVKDGSMTPPVEGATWDGSAQRWRGPDGKFIGEAPSEVEDETPAPVAPDGAQRPAGGETPPGEGVDSPPAPEAGKKPMTPFRLLNDKGEAIDPATLGVAQVEFTANGKTRLEPIDKVVRLAQYGFYNETLQQEVEQARATLPAVQAEKAQLLQERDELLGYYQRMLEDDDFVDAAREQYARLNSPEARAERAEQKLREVESQGQQAQVQQQVTQYLETELQPALAAILDHHPSVTSDELIGRFTVLTNKYMVNGVIPVERIPEINRVIVDELLPYVGQLHTSRTEAQRAEEARRAEALAAKEREAKAAEEAARKAEQVAHNRVARAIGPAGRASPDAPRPKPIETADDATEALVASLRAGI